MNRNTCRLKKLLLSSLLVLFAFGFYSQQAKAQSSAFQLQQFRPLGDPEGMFQTQSARTLGKYNYYVGLFLNFAKDPLTLRYQNSTSDDFMTGQFGLDLVGGFGVLEWLDVGLSIPMTLYQSGKYPDFPILPAGERNKDMSGFAFSDIKIFAKAQILKEKKHPLSWGFQLYLGLPTGSTEKMNGEDGVSFGVSTYLSKKISKFHIALNLGYRYLPPTKLFDKLAIQHEITYSLGASYNINEMFDIVADIGGATALSSLTSSRAAPLEFYLGARYYPLKKKDLAINLGGSFALTPGYGAPLFRVLLGVVWASITRDADGDGIEDAKDRCPKRAGPKENGGCPWGDADGDGLTDNIDKCPKKAGPKGNKGCPWGDADGDGLNDNVDKCPQKPGPEANKGCPWPDTDGDGLTDNIDKCPKKAGPKDNKGCPWGDTDNDGLKDNVDNCPKLPGPKENKGCPDQDRDNDGLVDRLDKCPDVPGVKARQGCPRKILVVVKNNEIKILQKIQFRTGSARILRRSYKILYQVVSVLKSRPKARVRIEGHTDNVGRPSYNLRLSKRRAASVRKFLIRRGKIDAARLESQGYGQTKPLVPNNSRKNRAINRRVQFKVLTQ